MVVEELRGLSSAGRAVALQASGRRFDPGRLHHSIRLREDIQVSEALSPIKEAELPVNLKIVKRGFAWPARAGAKWPSAATAPVLGSSQNDLVFSSMLFGEP